MSKITPVAKVEDKPVSTSPVSTLTAEQAPRVRLGDAMTPWTKAPKAPKARLGDAMMPW